jgi:hypothetical protein
VDEAAVAAFLRRQAKLGRNGKTVARRARNVVPGQSL